MTDPEKVKRLNSNTYCGESQHTAPLDGEILGPNEGNTVPHDGRPRGLDSIEIMAMSVLTAGIGFGSMFGRYQTPDPIERVPLQGPFRNSHLSSYEQRRQQRQLAVQAERDRAVGKQTKAARKKKEAARARARNKHR